MGIIDCLHWDWYVEINADRLFVMNSFPSHLVSLLSLCAYQEDSLFSQCLFCVLWAFGLLLPSWNYLENNFLSNLLFYIYNYSWIMFIIFYLQFYVFVVFVFPMWNSGDLIIGFCYFVSPCACYVLFLISFLFFFVVRLVFDYYYLLHLFNQATISYLQLWPGKSQSLVSEVGILEQTN